MVPSLSTAICQFNRVFSKHDRVTIDHPEVIVLRWHHHCVRETSSPTAIAPTLILTPVTLRSHPPHPIYFFVQSSARPTALVLNSLRDGGPQGILRGDVSCISVQRLQAHKRCWLGIYGGCQSSVDPSNCG